MAAIAFTWDCQVGIDVEHIRSLADMRQIAARYFSPEEAAELMLLPASEREHAFFCCWTRKEPYIKAVGDGLSCALDDCWGTSSHHVFFRNWLWGDATMNYTLPGGGITYAQVPTDGGPPRNNGGPTDPSGGFAAIDLCSGQDYYSFVGNVLGNSPGLHATWSGAVLRGNDPFATRANPAVYSLSNTTPGSHGTGSCEDIMFTTAPSSDSTVLLQGNYDFKTAGVAFWADANHTLSNSIYYSSKPSFFGSCTWPGIGPDITPVATISMPAYNRYAGMACTVSSTGSLVGLGSRLTWGVVVR
jgi:hypothetical protein